jgi:spoIIIJ-associated protein
MSDTQATDVETPTDGTTDGTAPTTGLAAKENESTEQGRAVETARSGELPEHTGSAQEQGEDVVGGPGAQHADADVSEHTDTADRTDAGDKGDKGDKKSRVRQLEREGEVAADFLETLLDIADLDGDIDVDVDGDRAAIAIVDSDEGRVPRRLVGTDGKVLEALQELTRLAVQVETGERSRLMLDIAGHRAQRRSVLVELAKAAITEVQESGTKCALEPMTAFERKVVHDEVAAAGLVSESEGVDPHRHIVILPA